MRKGQYKSIWSVEVMEQARADYESGGMTLSAISAKRAIPISTLRDWAYRREKWVKNQYSEQMATDVAAENLRLFAEANCALPEVIKEIRDGIFVARDTMATLADRVAQVKTSGVTEDAVKEILELCRKLVVDRNVVAKFIDIHNKMVGRYAPTKSEVKHGGIDFEVKFGKMTEAELAGALHEVLGRLKRVGVAVAVEMK
ncbi:MAG: hypothetical protein ABIH23_13135 [bacterium]